MGKGIRGGVSHFKSLHRNCRFMTIYGGCKVNKKDCSRKNYKKIFWAGDKVITLAALRNWFRSGIGREYMVIEACRMLKKDLFLFANKKAKEVGIK